MPLGRVCDAPSRRDATIARTGSSTDVLQLVQFHRSVLTREAGATLEGFWSETTHEGFSVLFTRALGLPAREIGASILPEPRSAMRF